MKQTLERPSKSFLEKSNKDGHPRSAIFYVYIYIYISFFSASLFTFFISSFARLKKTTQNKRNCDLPWSWLWNPACQSLRCNLRDGAGFRLSDNSFHRLKGRRGEERTIKKSEEGSKRARRPTSHTSLKHQFRLSFSNRLRLTGTLFRLNVHEWSYLPIDLILQRAWIMPSSRDACFV